MKLFDKQKPNAYKYIQQSLENDDDTELEIIFGSSEYTNPITKQVFMKLLEKCKVSYYSLSETNTLDIRQEFTQGKLSNVRCSVNGLQDIKKYCKQDTLDDIEDVEYIQKKYYKSESEPTFKFIPLRDEDLNLRLTLKKEEVLGKDDDLVASFLSNYSSKKKHFRYKKRFSFTTQDNLFRIDLTVVKSSMKKDGKYVLEKTFKKSGVLGNKETYELEIEYIGNSIDESGGVMIDTLYKKIQEGQVIPGPGDVNVGNVFDPLNISPTTYSGTKSKNVESSDIDEHVLLEGEIFDDSETMYGSPRYHKSVRVQSYMVSSKKYSQEEYQTLIGKYVMVKDSFWGDNPSLSGIQSKLKERTKGSVFKEHGVIKDVHEKITGDEQYIQTYVTIVFQEPIDGKQSLMVPLDDVYSNRFEVVQDEIKEIHGSFEEGSELSQRKLTSPIEELKDIIFDMLEKHIMYISKMIYNTDRLLSMKVKDDVIQNYKRLTGQKAKYFTFMGPQPVTLTKKHIQQGRKSIILDYAVTEKADGDRFEMYVYNKRGYLINSKQEVVDTGNTFNDIDGEWIFDGEYITRTKENESIHLYMIFDVYWCGKLTPKPIHRYPFVSLGEDVDRYTVMNDFVNKMMVNVVRDEFSIEVKCKEYLFGDQSTDDESTKTKIFEVSETLLQRDSEGEYPYRTDGLIYLPTQLSVKGSVKGVPKDFINGQWDFNFKWKPPEENTVDFMIKIEKDDIKKKVKDKIYEYSLVEETGTRVIGEYKRADLYVGYDIRRDTSLDYCMLILNDKKKEEKKEIIQFKGSDKYNKTNIPLTNGRMLCKNFDADEIKDGDIVEMRFVGDEENGMYWEPIRLRSDKTRPQDFMVAKNVWDTIEDPVTTEMVRGGYKEKKKRGEIQDNRYYVNNEGEDLPELIPIRKFHNYIKSNLIGGVCSSFKGKPIKFLDLSCGRGGDVSKLMTKENNISFILGLDISDNISEACMRFYHTKERSDGVFLQADTSKNIMDGSCSDIENIDETSKTHTDTMLSILYNRTNNVPKEYTSIFKKFKNKAGSGFDVISSQFSMHYYFKTEETFNGFIQNLNDNMSAGGYFIGTCYDGKRVFDLPDDITEYKDKNSHIVYSIEKKYSLESFDDENVFGNEIDVYMDSIGQTITEYLVNFEFFTRVMKDNGFELFIPKMDFKYSAIFQKKFIDNGVGDVGKVIEDLAMIQKNDPSFKRFYSGGYQVKTNKALGLLSSLNNYFIFQKK